MKITIGKKTISSKSKSFIVAEMSGNHGGSLNEALNIIKAAKKSGVDAIKLQTYTADTITLKSNRKDFLIPKKSPWRSKKNLWNLYNYAYTPWVWNKKLFSFAKKLGLEIFSSPFDESAVDHLEKLKCSAYKIASPEMNHIPLIRKVAKTKKPIILSTGLSNLEDLNLAIKNIRLFNSNRIIILSCVSKYPASPHEYNLRELDYFKKKYSAIVGISDHTKDNSLSIASLPLGAKVFEKHFVLKKNINKTVDSFFSETEVSMKNYVDNIRKIEISLNGKKKKLPKGSKFMRSIYVSKNINKGEIISKKNIKICRPGFSLHPKYFDKIIGLKSKKKLIVGDRISLSLFKTK